MVYAKNNLNFEYIILYLKEKSRYWSDFRFPCVNFLFGREEDDAWFSFTIFTNWTRSKTFSRYFSDRRVIIERKKIWLLQFYWFCLVGMCLLWLYLQDITSFYLSHLRNSAILFKSSTPYSPISIYLSYFNRNKI